MAKKVYKFGNYIRFEDTVSGDVTEISSQDLRYRNDVGSDYDFYDKFNQAFNVKLPFSVIVKEDGTPYESEAVFVDWLAVKTSVTGTLDVLLQDATSPLMVVHASNIVAESTLAVATAIDDYSITVASGTGFVIGQYLTIYNAEDNRVFFADVLNVATNVITINVPLDFAFSIGSFVSVGIKNMNVNGSVTPQIFGIRNPSGTDIPLKYDISRVMFYALCNSPLDLSKFGDIAGGIARGVIVRRTDGITRNLFDWKTNAELKEIAYDFAIENALGGALDGFHARLTFAGQEKMGAVVRLAEDEDLQIIIQDNLTSLVYFGMTAEGSEVVD